MQGWWILWCFDHSTRRCCVVMVPVLFFEIVPEVELCRKKRHTSGWQCWWSSKKTKSWIWIKTDLRPKDIDVLPDTCYGPLRLNEHWHPAFPMKWAPREWCWTIQAFSPIPDGWTHSHESLTIPWKKFSHYILFLLRSAAVSNWPLLLRSAAVSNRPL